MRVSAAAAVVVLVLVLLGANVGAQEGVLATVEAAQAEAAAGEIVEVALELRPGSEPVGALGIELRFDPDLLTPAVDGDGAIACTSESGLGFCGADDSPGRLVFSGLNASGWDQDLTLVSIGFVAGPDSGDSPIELVLREAVDLDAQPLAVETIDGQVRVREQLVPGASPTDGQDQGGSGGTPVLGALLGAMVIALGGFGFYRFTQGRRAE